MDIHKGKETKTPNIRDKITQKIYRIYKSGLVKKRNDTDLSE